MERLIALNYHWNLSDYPDISNEIRDMLDEEAEKRIYEMRSEGYTSGELHAIDENDNQYWGWWNFKRTFVE